jgi:hypothetical protein
VVIKAVVVIKAARITEEVITEEVITEEVITEEVITEEAGVGLSGLGLYGVDGGHGGVLRTIPIIIHTTRRHPWLSSNSLRRMSSRRNSIIGISAKIPRDTIHT